uniref:Uncharacterized protein n=1 Tax=Arundo donax TaxID=35708 RepID=A0A0A9EUL2_ARUDO
MKSMAPPMMEAWSPRLMYKAGVRDRSTLRCSFICRRRLRSTAM